MFITTGLGSVDDYPEYVQAGAGEMFLGYIPLQWMKTAGTQRPLNRREVLYYNVQLGSESELRILRDMREQFRVPVTVALNSPYYDPGYYPEILAYMKNLMHLGFYAFILADPGLLLHVKNAVKNGFLPQFPHKPELHLSGEAGEINQDMIDFARECGIRRIIFHRKVLLQEMEEMIRIDRDRHPDAPIEYEAFLLNEMCHFHGGYCNSFHCDEFLPICQLPYRLGSLDEKCISDSMPLPEAADRDTWYEKGDIAAGASADEYLTGQSGCGLCALYRMKAMGITHVKLVSRGNYTEDTLRDLHAIRTALSIAECSKTEEDYRNRMRKTLFPNGCSRNCYYR